MKRNSSDLRLQRLFADYNDRYFGGRLPQETAVRWSRKVAEKCCEGDCGFRGIRLNPQLRHDEEGLRQTLLHEMVHLLAEGEPQNPLTWTDHGTWFKRQMRRLERQGALKIMILKWGDPIAESQIGKVKTHWHQKVCY